MKSRPFTARVRFAVVVCWIWTWFLVTCLLWYLSYIFFGLTDLLKILRFFGGFGGGSMVLVITFNLVLETLWIRRIQTRVLVQLAKSFLAALRELYENNCESGVVFVSHHLLLQRTESDSESLSVSILCDESVGEADVARAELALDLAVVMYTRPLLMRLRPEQIGFSHKILPEAEFEELWKECPE